MTFKHGKVKTGGRKKGTRNKRSQEITERLAALNCDPIERMAKIAEQAMTENNLELAGRMYKELAQYVAPKCRAIAHIGADSEELGAVMMVPAVVNNAEVRVITE